MRAVVGVVLLSAFRLFAGVMSNAELDRVQANAVPAIGQNAADVVASGGDVGLRVLFVGNSITRHGPKPQIGWTNDCGMAASSRECDYMHLVAAKIKEKRPDASFGMLQVAGSVERAFYRLGSDGRPVSALDLDCFKWAREYHPDIIIMFFGANVPKAYDSDPAPPMKFGEALDRLRRYLDPASCAKCYFVEGFYLRPVLDAEKKKTAKKFRDVYVPLGDIRQRSDVRGLYNHPNDRGMLLIAERIWKYLEGGGLAREPGRYGAQAHVTGRWFEEREQACKTMAEAGLTRLRTDFVPKNCYDEKTGRWNWERFDKVLETAEKHGLHVLPILAVYGDGDLWRPGSKRHDFWFSYVSNVVTRYRGRISEVEIWNEPNHPRFWPNPSPTNYVALLKPTYELVKRIDPTVRVVIGGTAGVGIKFFNGVYKLGGKPFFDVMNCHPYSYPYGPDGRLDKAVDDLRSLMGRYGDGDKPIYITEHGWPTQKMRLGESEALLAALRILRPGKSSWRVAYLPLDFHGPAVSNVVSAIRETMPTGSFVEALPLENLKERLVSGNFDLVLYPYEADIPLESVDVVHAFVKQGGILADFGGLPLGTSEKGALARKRLRISASTQKEDSSLPKLAKALVTPRAVAAGWKQELSGLDVDVFFDDALLKSGDEFIPLLTAEKGLKDFDWPVGKPQPVATCIYRFDSDMKGAVIVSARGEMKSGRLQCGTDESHQAEFLRRSCEICREKGVEGYYVYALKTKELDPYYSEDNFGIVHADYTPKPAYAAIRDFIAEERGGGGLRSGASTGGDASSTR